METVINENEIKDVKATTKARIKKETKVGSVICKLLNVRKKASAEAPILTIIEAKTKVTINAESGDWYNVTLEDGTKGFCMKEFIQVD